MNIKDEMTFDSPLAQQSIDRCKELTIALLDTMMETTKRWEAAGVQDELIMGMVMTACTMYMGDVVTAAVKGASEEGDEALHECVKRIADGATTIAKLNIKILSESGDFDEVRH